MVISSQVGTAPPVDSGKKLVAAASRNESCQYLCTNSPYHCAEFNYFHNTTHSFTHPNDTELIRTTKLDIFPTPMSNWIRTDNKSFIIISINFLHSVNMCFQEANKNVFCPPSAALNIHFFDYLYFCWVLTISLLRKY